MANNNRSLIELQDNISIDFVKRRDELHFFKDLLRKHPTSIESQVLSKSLIVNLYSHWEGFIKYSSECFLQYVSHQRLKYNELNYGLIAISHLTYLNQYLESNIALKIRALETLIENSHKRASVPNDYIISTYSNLNTETLEEICLIVGIDEANYSLKKGIIDERLLANRNKIAHGNLIRLESKDSLEICDLVLPIMEAYKTDILNRALLVASKKLAKS